MSISPTEHRPFRLRPEGRVERSAVARFLRGEGLLVAVGAVFCFSATLSAHAALHADSWLSFLGGREILAHGIPHHDSLAVMSAGRPWIDQQWLSEIVLYGLVKAGGVKLVLLFSIVLQLAALVLAVRFARRRGASPVSIAPFVLVSWLAFSSWLRTQIFSELLFVLLLGLLASESRRRSRRVWLALPLLALWANVHGAVVVGAALVALLGVTEIASLVRERAGSARLWARPLALVVTPWLCVLATPYGLSILDYYHSTLSNPAFRQYLTEWKPPTLVGPGGIGSDVEGTLFFVLAAGAAVLVARRARELTAFELGSLGLTLVGALLAVRSIPWFAFSCLMLVPALLERSWGKGEEKGRTAWLPAATALAACLAAVTILVSAAAAPSGAFTRAYPAGAVAAVDRAARRDPGARVLASYALADWLLYESPSLRGRVAFDGRWEVLSAGQMARALDYLYQGGPGWERLASEYSVFVLSPAKEPGLVAEYDHRAGMRTLYRDALVAVFSRRPPR